MKKRPSILGTLIFAAVFFIAGLMTYKHITKPIAEEAEASKDWPTVQGTVTHAELTKSRDNDGNDMYSANIRYNYVVDGNSFNSSNIKTVDGSTSMKSSVKKTLKKYAKGTKVAVHYDPEFPNTAVLETGTSFLFGLLLKLPLLFCAVSVLMVFSLFKRLLFG
ncbi:Protein of unknown function [Saccharicrinis carchari]|uniref:DUF3592 domain-containing protein n=1 Tax=Saccharicrinis carchari TaxID=1168039 RepID=A0A521EAC0_SACCC|nr:DUF3592 domain-containing protein [Saccharicrinis carchari]SMO80391.1 Protein of unknown function [Saccharicrinis carchari]